MNSATAPLPGSFVPRLDGEVIVAVERREEFAHDFGGNHHRLPGVVVRAASESDLIAALAFARDHGLPVAVRGAGHSVDGQTLSRGGLVIANCSDRPDVRMLPGDLVEVGARTRWGDLERILNRAGRTAPVLTNHLTMTVGGTLSVGGYGERSVAVGAHVAQVERVRLVLASGEPVWCSREENGHLFQYCLAGLGQVGIIERVVMRTAPLPRHSRFIDYELASARALGPVLAWLDGGEERELPDSFAVHIPWIDGRPSVYRVRLGFDGRPLATAIALPRLLARQRPARVVGLAAGTAVAEDANQLSHLAAAEEDPGPLGPPQQRWRQLWADQIVDHAGAVTLLAQLPRLVRRARCGPWLRYMLVLAIRTGQRAYLPFEGSSVGPPAMKFLVGSYFAVPASGDDSAAARIRGLFRRALESCVALRGRPYLYGCVPLDQALRAQIYGEPLARMHQLKRELDPEGRLNPDTALSPRGARP